MQCGVLCAREWTCSLHNHPEDRRRACSACSFEPLVTAVHARVGLGQPGHDAVGVPFHSVGVSHGDPVPAPICQHSALLGARTNGGDCSCARCVFCRRRHLKSSTGCRGRRARLPVQLETLISTSRAPRRILVLGLEDPYVSVRAASVTDGACHPALTPWLYTYAMSE
ncbi:hypothetical protein OH76DRAFT_1157514 [Lentinus brumalis]|uniref:Uncharacterized protein n=1 Tax=Lentinus brumalis TaxID=2498619 RepID=A0A371DMS8_9APHY|nr:hypothetical protein OH76DRAFT_1157514 [Polyporus brumalis]